MAPTWLFTVASATCSRSAISAFVVPRAIRPEHVVFSIREQLEAGRVAGRRRHHSAISVEDPRRDGGVEPGAAPGYRPHRGDQILRGAVLQHESSGAGLNGSPQDLVLAECREHEDGTRVLPAAQLRGGGDAVEPRHADVHERDVRAHHGQLLDGLLAVGALGDHVEPVVGGEDPGQAGADDGLVVDEGDADHGVRASSTGIASVASSGSRQLTCQPSGVGPAAKSPPSAVARSLIPTRP
jgi:hypothetical protein